MPSQSNFRRYFSTLSRKFFFPSEQLPPPGILHIFFAFSLALILLSALEILQIPKDMLLLKPGRWFHVLTLSLNGALHHLRYDIIYLGQITLTLYAYQRVPKHRPVIAGIGLAWCVLITIMIYICLTSYVRFQGYWLFAVLFILGGVFLSVIYLEMLAPVSGASKHRWQHTVRKFLPPLVVIAAAATLHYLNFVLYPDVYPTLHLSILSFTVILFTLGLGLLLSRLAFRSRGFRVFEGIWLLVFAHIFFLIPHFSYANLFSTTIPLYERYTLLGQANMIDRDIVAPEADATVNLATGKLHPRDFLKATQFPTLPPTFSLKDYNILLVTVESLRYDQTSLYNRKWRNTPTLEKMRNEGAYSFEFAFSSSMKTMVSLSSLMSMTYPSFTRLRLSRNPAFGSLEESETTVAELLQKAGYQTFRVSHNFARVFSRLNHGFEQGFERNHLICRSTKSSKCDLLIADKAIQEIDHSLEDKKPFFGWVFLSAPHASYLTQYEDMPDKTDIQRFRQEIRYSDEQLSRILAHLKKQQLDKSTIVIVMGDHGEEFKEHGRDGHNSIYVEGSNVALVIRIPGINGHVISEPTSTLYLFPWLFLKGPQPLFAAAASRIRNDFGPMMKNTDNAVIVELLGVKRSEVALQKGDLRIHYDFASKYYELFNLRKDRREMNNIYNPAGKISTEYRTLVQKYLGVRKKMQRVIFRK